MASCLPGAELTKDLGDDKYEGLVAIRMGPVRLRFTGTADITERDDAAKRIVVHAAGADEKGRGQAAMVVGATLSARDGVDVTTLFPSQIELFKTADPSQQMRLVELWRISPPNYGGHALAQDLGTWPATSFQQEEAMAKFRYERRMLEERASRTQITEDQQEHFDGGEDVMSDGEQSNAPMTPIQGGDGRWPGATYVSHATEPYMVSGYESLAQREYELSARRPSKDVSSVVALPPVRLLAELSYTSHTG